MKKLVVLTALILLSGLTFGQTFQKGNLVGQHVGIIILDPDVTYNQYKDFFINKYIPAFEKQFQGEVTMYSAEGDRGDDANCISISWVFKSVEVRDKYFTQEGTATELFNSKMGNLQAIIDEGNKLGTFSQKHYTDWVIQ